ncbi:DNA polymerase III subunit gamma/tau [Alteromonas sp. MMG017]|uniref:DNA polymerase III subunit gamma/tau n=1 Tax=Alteromonas sp. MMG017 TaxID=2822692 RepID=UPI001B39D495|nr:DNA polymerase III subunit gamma/tau [Alteromonas sp. MMG017]MBQ4831370.1 DNA polymerase III subunit gamma/tau [Alteromonas sp. MMG017]
MSYQVLARKWRPGKFSELVGQEHVVSAISNALDNDRLHHAYLFTGTRGVGKTTIARIFSKSLNCEEGQGSNPCGQCNTCKEIEQGNYVDLLEIDAASRTKVEDTRELLDNVQYKPTRGRYKVYLIDEVHMLSKHSFNALLKTLEEPPPHVKFLLATTDPQKLPITILSRCLQFNLKALSREQIVGQLNHILEQEALPFEPQALALLARAAQGSMRDALSLTDQAIAQGGNAVNASVVTDMLGLMDKNQLVKLLHAVVSKTPADVMQLVQDMSEQAPDYDHVLAELGSTLHQIALTQWVPEACKLETTSAKAIYQLAKSISAEQVQLLYQIALQGRKDLPFSSDGRSALEMTLMRMMTFAPSTPLADAPSEIAGGTVDSSLPIASAEKKTLISEPEAQSTTSAASSFNAESAEGAKSQSHEESTEAGSASAGEEVSNNKQDAESANVLDAATAIDETAHAQTDVNFSSTDVADSTASQITPSEQETSVYEKEVHNEVASQSGASFEQAEQSQQVAHSKDGQPSGASQPTANNQPSVDDRPSSDEPPSKEDGQQTQSLSPVHTSSDSAPFNDMPPADAYMDDMPPPYDDDGESSFMPPDFADAQLSNAPLSDESADSQTTPKSTPTPEAQLTSTADMLALRQRLKQKRDESAEQAAKKPEATNETTSFVDRMSKASSQGSLAPSSEGQGDEQFKGEPDEAAASVETSYNNAAPAIASATEPSSSATSNSNVDSDTNLSAGANTTSNVSTQNHSDMPPWDTGVQHNDEPFAANANEHATRIDSPMPDAPQYGGNSEPAYNETQQTESAGNEASQTESVGHEPGPNEAHNEFSAEPVNQFTSEYQGKLAAYLDDGSKLVHASQIDKWSNDVEQMPIAGLLKQLVLHASFLRNDQGITLEIDNSQAHLLKDSAKQQLLDVLHHSFGEGENITITLGSPNQTPYALQQDIIAMRQAHAQSVVHTDETIQALLSAFDASIVTDSVKAR